MAEEDEMAQRASEQARLRKERREAKIKAGGSARLNKISGIGGRIVGDSEQVPDPVIVLPEIMDESSSSTTFPFSSKGEEDSAFSEAQLRQIMLGGRGQENATTGGQDDPLMKMMSQMMSGFGDASSSSSSSSPFPNNFPFLSQQQQQQQQGVTNPDKYTFIFRLLHALLSLSLGLYLSLILLTPPNFTGSRTDREQQSFITSSAEDEHRKLIFFWLFATGEAILLSSRFFLDKSRRQPPTGLLWSVVGFLPHPIKGYLSVGLRYGQIFMTVRADILACVFVLGVVCWWRA